MSEATIKRKNSIHERAKRSPIEVKLYVCFWMEWLRLNINPSRFHTAKEANLAHKWAKKMTKVVMKEYKEWEENGRPTYKKQKK